MEQRVRRRLILGTWGALLGAAALLGGLALGRPLYYTDGVQVRTGFALARVGMWVWGSPEPELELPGPVRGRVAQLPDGRLLYGRAASTGDTDLVAFDPRHPAAGVEVAAALCSTGHDLAPAVAADGTIWFASDRAGGAGGYDLYQSRLGPDGFATPVAVAACNTMHDETDPAPDPTGGVVFARIERSRRAGNGVLFRWAGDAQDPLPVFSAAPAAVADDRDPVFAPDGSALWFVRQSAGRSELLRSARLQSVFDPPVRVDGGWGTGALRSPLPLSGTSLGVLRPASGEGLPDQWLKSRGRELLPWWTGQRWLETVLFGICIGAAVVLLLLHLGARWRSLDLVTLCLLLSLLVHLLLMLWLMGVEIAGSVQGADDESGAVQVTLIDGNRGRGTAEGVGPEDIEPLAQYRPQVRELTAEQPGSAVAAVAPDVASTAATWTGLAVAGQPDLAPTPLRDERDLRPERGSVDAASLVERAATSSVVATTLAAAGRSTPAAESFTVELPAGRIGAASIVPDAIAPPAVLPAPPSRGTDAGAAAAPLATLRDAPPGPVAPAEDDRAKAESAIAAALPSGLQPVIATAAPAAALTAADAAAAASRRAAARNEGLAVVVPRSVLGPATSTVVPPAAQPPARAAPRSGSMGARGVALRDGPAAGATKARAAAAAAAVASSGTGGASLPATSLPPVAHAVGSGAAMPARRLVGVEGAQGAVAADRPGARLAAGATQSIAAVAPRLLPMPTAGARGGAARLQDEVAPAPANVVASGSGPAIAVAPILLGALAMHATDAVAARRALAGSLVAPRQPAVQPPGSLLRPANRELLAPAEAAAGVASAYSNRFGPARQRAIEQFGGTADTERAVRDGLRYLAAIQREDGGWGDDRFDDKYGSVRIGKSALCLLAFLGAGHTPASRTEHAAAVQRAVEFLLGVQERETGAFGISSAYGHGIATYALAECYGITKDARLRRPVEDALAWILQHQGPRRDRRNLGGWGYFSPGLEAEDDYARVSITAWMVMALESARMSGIELPEDVLPQARQFLEQAWDRQQRFFRYNHKRSRLVSAWPTLPASTPAGAFCMLLLGAGADDAIVEQAVSYTVERRPHDYRRYTDDEFVLQGQGNVYFWYYGTLCCFLAGGEAWQAWNDRLRAVLPPAQEADGSWAPIDAYARSAGDTAGDRAYTTSMCVLSLEIYYRYFTPLLLGR